MLVPRLKEGELKAVWGKESGGAPEIIYCNGGSDELGKCSARDATLLIFVFELPMEILNGNTLKDELILRGYDITTLKFSIQLRKDA